MKHALFIAAAVLFLVTGCDPTIRTNTISAPIGGRTFDIQDAIFLELFPSDPRVTVYLTEQSNMCTAYKRQVLEASKRMMRIQLNRQDEEGNLLPITPGVYNAVRGLVDSSWGALAWADVDFFHHSTGCSPVSEDGSEVMKGTVTVDEIKLQGGGTISGTYELVVGEQARELITGTFYADYCDGIIYTDPGGARCE